MKENTNSLNLFAPFYSISFLSVPHFNLRHHSGLTFPNSIHILFITNTVIFKKVKISRYLSCLFFFISETLPKALFDTSVAFWCFSCMHLQMLAVSTQLPAPNLPAHLVCYSSILLSAIASIIQGQHFILRRVHTLVVWAYLSSPDSRSQH